MKKLSILAATAALTLSAVAPVAAETAVQSDPFVSTQGGIGGFASIPGGVLAGFVLTAVIVTSADGT